MKRVLGTTILKVIIFILLLCNVRSFGRNERMIDSIRQELKKTIHDTVKVALLNDLGAYYGGDRKYTEGRKHLMEAYDLAEKINYETGALVSLNRMGITYLGQNDYLNALDYFSRALLIAKKINNKKGIADITSNIGIIHSDKGEYALALENYLAALKIREEIKDARGTAGSLMAIGNIHYLQNKFSNALKFYLKVLEVKNVDNDSYFYAEALYNIGLAYLELKDYNKALTYLNYALKIDEEIGDKQGVALVYTNMGTIHYILGDYKKALEVTTNGYIILKQLNDKKGIAESNGELGVIYDSLKLSEKALECYTNQLNISKEIGNKFNMRKAYIYLSNHYQLKHNYKEAYDYYTLYKSMEDSIKNESSIKAISELEAKYETQNKEKQIELLKTEQQLQAAENTKQKQLIYGSFILAIVIAFAGFVFYNRQQIKKKSLLEKKNFELERNALSAQMNPHFIFNSLGSISGFISENDKEKAIEYLGIFSRLIRHNLEQSREQLISVAQEAQMLKSYLFLQQLRYNNAFTFEIQVAESIEMDVAIPPMFIQPFVENAIIHGIIPKNETGAILIKFYQENETAVICEVHDDGIGRDESKKRKTVYDQGHKSLAMTITEERVQIINSMNKEKIQISMNDVLANNAVKGTLVKIIFPVDYI